MTLPKCFHCSDRARLVYCSLLLLLPLLAGCGTSSYNDAVTKSKPELELRGKFAVLDQDYVRFPDFPISFRVPRMFIKDDDPNTHRWKTFGGKALKANSKDPNSDSVIPLPAAFIIPPEFNDQILNQAHQGTYLADYKVPLEDPMNPQAKSYLTQHLMMSIWVFDTANKKIPVPNDAAMLSGVKSRGKEAQALTAKNALNAKDKEKKNPPEKPGSWEEDDIGMAPTAGSARGTIPTKLAKLYVKSAFLSTQDMQGEVRRPVEKDGVVRLWSFKLDNKYQVFLMLRVALEMTADTAEFPFDPTLPESDKLVDIGRAVIGSMVVTPEDPAAEPKKK